MASDYKEKVINLTIIKTESNKTNNNQKIKLINSK